MRHTSRRWVVLAFLGGLLALGGWAVLAGLSARDDLLQVRAVAQAVREELDAEQPPDPADLRAQLQPATEAAADARRSLLRPGPALVARIPVLGRSLAAERDAALSADALLGTAATVLAELEQLQVTQGRVDVAALQRIAAALEGGGEELVGPLLRLESAPLGLTPDSVRDAVVQAREELAGLDRQLQTAGAAVRGLAGVLGADGARTVVVMLMNNAELRGAGGYGGSFAVMQSNGGEISLGPFQDVNDVQDEPDQVRRVPAPAGYEARWGPYLANSTLWKNTLMSADQPTAAAVTCDVVRLAPGAPCDAVVLLDIPALAGLVELSGPLDLGDDDPVGGEDLVRELLVEAYADSEETGDQAARRARLRAAADGAVGDVLDSGLAGVDAARVAVDAVRGRHLALWSARPQEQQAFVDAGLAGDVDPDGGDLNLVSVNQFSAGKLDYYVDRSVGLLAVVDEDEAVVTQKVTLRLDAPAGLPTYVLGPRGARLDELMDIAVSPDATGITLRQNGREIPVRLAAEDGSRRVVVQVVLGLGQTATWEVSYRVPLPDGEYRLRLLPQPLARDAVLHLAVVPAPGRTLVDGEVRYDGPYDRGRRVQVRLGP